MPARAFALADTVLQSEVAEAARAVHSAESRFLLRRVIQLAGLVLEGASHPHIDTSEEAPAPSGQPDSETGGQGGLR